MSKLPSIPAISSKIPNEVSSLLRPMREILMSFMSGSSKVATLQGLIDSGVTGADGKATNSSSGGNVVIDSTPPPAPTGLTIGGALATVILSWDETSSQLVSYVEIWRAETDSFASAQLIGRAEGRIYADSLGGGALRYYWIRYVSKYDAIKGPFNSQTGTPGETGLDAAYLISVLSANPPNGASYNKLLYVQETPTTVNGVAVPAGTYMSQAYIANGSITNAKIGNATIESAKIVSLDAAKINAISLSAISAKLGSITSGDIYGTTLHGGTGYPTAAYAWPSNGGIGFHLSSSGLLLGNSSLGKYFEVDSNGDIYAPGLTIINGQASFYGSISVNNNFIVDASGNVTIRNATSGARLNITNSLITVHDGNGTIRVRLGLW